MASNIEDSMKTMAIPSVLLAGILAWLVGSDLYERHERREAEVRACSSRAFDAFHDRIQDWQDAGLPYISRADSIKAVPYGGLFFGACLTEYGWDYKDEPPDEVWLRRYGLPVDSSEAPET